MSKILIADLPNTTIHDVKRMYDGKTPQGNVMRSYVHAGHNHWQVVDESFDTGKSFNPRANDESITLSERWDNIRKIWGF